MTARYFDLFVYFANWGSRRLSIRLPKRFLDAAGLKRFIGVSQSMAVRTAGENLIIDVFRDEIEIEDHDGDPLLRAEVRRRCRVPASPVEDWQARRSAGEQRAIVDRLLSDVCRDWKDSVIVNEYIIGTQSGKEIADKYDISEDLVYQRARRLRVRLMKWLNERGITSADSLLTGIAK